MAMLAAPTARHQPAEPSARQTSSMTSNWVTGSASRPPISRGAKRPHRPLAVKASMAAGQRVRARSESSALASSTPAMARARPINAGRLSSCCPSMPVPRARADGG